MRASCRQKQQQQQPLHLHLLVLLCPRCRPYPLRPTRLPLMQPHQQLVAVLESQRVRGRRCMVKRHLQQLQPVRPIDPQVCLCKRSAFPTWMPVYVTCFGVQLLLLPSLLPLLLAHAAIAL